MPIRYVNFDDPKHKVGFKNLNLLWIEKYFGVEEIDLFYLDNPQEQIIDKGGFIIIAEALNQVVGTCAMIKMHSSNYDFELAKMGVLPQYRRMGVAADLANICLKQAKSKGAKSIYLESNSVLAPALKLYKKLGFVETEDITSPYKRCNIQMRLDI